MPEINVDVQLRLWEPCWRCGNRQWTTRTKGPGCKSCRGKGYHLTDDGKELVKFLEMFPNFAELLKENP